MSNNPKDSEIVDIAAVANRRICDFVHDAGNECLRPGTGSYSTPFRGSLFGREKAADVAQLLATRRVDVLWLGANPNAPPSLENILNPPKDDGDFPDFMKQMESGYFGCRTWEGNTPIDDWNPIESPRRGWRTYRDLFRELGSPECVAMANFIPWGSKSAEAFINQLKSVKPSLLKDIIKFADDLNAEIVQALKPKLVVVPFSLGRNPSLKEIGLSLKRADGIKPHVVHLAEVHPFKFYTACCRRGNLCVPTVFVRHPSSLRFSQESKKRVVAEVADTLRRFQEV